MATAQRILIGDVREQLASLPAAAVQCVITSPPYWGLRDYGMDGQIGMESDFQDYIQTLVEIFRDVRRVLREDGTLWLNLGDTYQKGKGQAGGVDLKQPARLHMRPTAGPNNKAGRLPNKNLIGIPWRVALALQADGWFLRDEIIWHKPAPMPSSAKDRSCRAHEQIFLLSQKPNYFFDWYALTEEAVSGNRNSQFATGKTGQSQQRCSLRPRADYSRRMGRSVWRISSRGYKGAHFAVYPPALVQRCLLAGSSAAGCCAECGSPLERQVDRVRVPTRPGTNSKVNLASDDPDSPYEQHAGTVVGNRDPLRHVTEYRTSCWAKRCECVTTETVPCVVLDPFLGSGTTLAVAREWGRSGIGIELNPEYAALARQRIDQVQPRMIELAEVI